MATESVILTGDEAASLRQAVDRIVSRGIRIHDSELAIPAAEPKPITGSSAENLSVDPLDPLPGGPALVD